MNDSLSNLVKSDWRPKENFPKLEGKAKIISLDVETYDPNLKENGPGALRGDGYIVGFSIATDDGFKCYYPIKHEGGDNLENPKNAIRWLKDQLEGKTDKLGANILYDLIWLKCDLGINVGGKKYDIQIAEPLLDDNRLHYTLDSLSQSYLKESKKEHLLLDAGKLLLGFKGKGKTQDEIDEDIISQVKSNIWRLPARYIGEYGEGDVELPIKIFKEQTKKLKEEGLWELFEETETPLIDLLLDMWVKGVPVDIKKGEEVRDKLQSEYDGVIKKISKKVGFKPDIWSQEDIVKACNKLGLNFPYTDKGNPSFEAKWLKEQSNIFFTLLLEARQLERSGSIFIEKKILDLAVGDRIHPQFWQVKTERYGTASGRFSSSNPNAQQFPARNEIIAKQVRSLLIAEEGKKWVKFDYSQQEPRVTVHYAALLNLPGADVAKQRYIQNPNTDYHQLVADMVLEISGFEITRRIAKDLNLGLAYGMGKTKLAETLGLPFQEAEKIFEAFHKSVPFIKLLGDHTKRVANQRGYIKTLLGRKQRFNLWGPANWNKGIIPKSYNEAIEEFGRPVQRYFLHKAMNRLVQGGSADMIKKAMVDCYKIGYIPCLTVHDELDFCNITTKKQIKEIKNIMLNCIKLVVPLVVIPEIGKNWGELEEVKI